jgi:hypothetical protein
MIDREAFLRERALMMAQSDWMYGRIERSEIFSQARGYEAYLLGRPIPITDLSENSVAPQSETASGSTPQAAIQSLPRVPL